MVVLQGLIVHRSKSGSLTKAHTKSAAATGLAVTEDLPVTGVVGARMATLGVPGTDTTSGASFKRPGKLFWAPDAQPELNRYLA